MAYMFFIFLAVMLKTSLVNSCENLSQSHVTFMFYSDLEHWCTDVNYNSLQKVARIESIPKPNPDQYPIWISPYVDSGYIFKEIFLPLTPITAILSIQVDEIVEISVNFSEVVYRFAWPNGAGSCDIGKYLNEGFNTLRFFVKNSYSGYNFHYSLNVTAN